MAKQCLTPNRCNLPHNKRSTNEGVKSALQNNETLPTQKEVAIKSRIKAFNSINRRDKKQIVQHNS